MTHSSKSLTERHKDDEDEFRVWTPSGREGPSIEPSSVDLHLGKHIGRTNHRGTVQVWNKNTYPDFGVWEEEKPVISPGEFALAHTEEEVTIPQDAVGFLHGRSSVGRLGLFIHNAGLVDAGFRGDLTLELFNPAPYPIQLKFGMGICQMTVHPHDEKPDVPYSRENGNKYNDQRWPTPSKLYEDFE